MVWPDLVVTVTPPYPSAICASGSSSDSRNCRNERTRPILERSGPGKPPRPRMVWQFAQPALPKNNALPVAAHDHAIERHGGQVAQVGDNLPDLVAGQPGRRHVGPLHALGDDGQ